jgi:hypothetical protein
VSLTIKLQVVHQGRLTSCATCIKFSLRPYQVSTKTVVSSHYVVEDCDKFVVRCRRLQYDSIRLCNVFDRFPVLEVANYKACIRDSFFNVLMKNDYLNSVFIQNTCQ